MQIIAQGTSSRLHLEYFQIFLTILLTIKPSTKRPLVNITQQCVNYIFEEVQKVIEEYYDQHHAAQIIQLSLISENIFKVTPLDPYMGSASNTCGAANETNSLSRAGSKKLIPEIMKNVLSTNNEGSYTGSKLGG